MQLKCSLCGKNYEFVYIKDEPLPAHFPFCSKRCKSIDLGKWLNEEYRISTPLPDSNELTKLEQDAFSEIQEETLLKLVKSEKDTE